jgi:hypothetical protein
MIGGARARPTLVEQGKELQSQVPEAVTAAGVIDCQRTGAPALIAATAQHAGVTAPVAAASGAKAVGCPSDVRGRSSPRDAEGLRLPQLVSAPRRVDGLCAGLLATHIGASRVYRLMLAARDLAAPVRRVPTKMSTALRNGW